MSRSSTCVLIYAMLSLQRCMPCIFVIYVVTITSMQTRLRYVFDFRDLVILLVCDCCYFVAMYPCGYREIHFVDMVVLDPSMPLFAIMECHSMS